MVERSMKNKQEIGYKILPQLPPLFFLWETALENRFWHHRSLELDPNPVTPELYNLEG